MSYPLVIEPEYKLPEDGITLSQAILEVYEVRDEYDDRLDYSNPFYQD